MTVKALVVPAMSGLGKPATVKAWRVAGWTAIADAVALKAELAVSVAAIHWIPAVIRSTEKVCVAGAVAENV